MDGKSSLEARNESLVQEWDRLKALLNQIIPLIETLAQENKKLRRLLRETMISRQIPEPVRKELLLRIRSMRKELHRLRKQLVEQILAR